MAMTSWAPFGALTTLEREMQALERDLHSLLGRVPSGLGEAWRPDMDVYREGNSLVVRAELPGIDPAEDLEIEVEDNVLHLRGHKTVEREIDEDDRYLRECRFGSFERQVVLPEGVDPDSVAAVYENGVLTVRIPLPAVEVEKSRKIPIRVDVKRTPASKIPPD